MCQASDDYRYFLINLGKNIRKYRLNRKMSQEKLALNIDSARNYIGCIEKKKKMASLITLFKISKVLNVNIEDFFKHTMVP